MITLRAMQPEDIHAGLSLCRATGWNQLHAEWDLFLEESPDRCLVAVDGSTIVGTVTTLRYQDHFSWIGMLLVDPGMRRKGIGTQLLRAALEVLQEEQSIKLDATPAGRLVYLNLGFRDEYPIRRMMAGRIAWETLKPGHARPIQRSDFDRLMEYDRTVFGADREALLRWIWTAGQPFGYLVEEDGKIAGYCFGRPGHQFTHIGPVVAQQPHHAVDLLSTALKACGEQGVILDTLLHSPSWLGWLTSCGFVEQRNFMRMVYGPNRWPGVPELSFAILGPEFG